MPFHRDKFRARPVIRMHGFAATRASGSTMTRTYVISFRSCQTLWIRSKVVSRAAGETEGGGLGLRACRRGGKLFRRCLFSRPASARDKPAYRGGERGRPPAFTINCRICGPDHAATRRVSPSAALPADRFGRITAQRPPLLQERLPIAVPFCPTWHPKSGLSTAAAAVSYRANPPLVRSPARRRLRACHSSRPCVPWTVGAGSQLEPMTPMGKG
jgi:hypothetical protein